MEEDARKSEEILCLTFNQDGSCLAVGRPRGFDIFSTESTALLHREDCGVVRLVEMLFRTSLVALVGDALGRQLTMWNTKARAGICSLQFPAEICNVKMNHRRAVVLLRQKVHIFDLKTMKGLHVIDRSDQAPGLDPGLCSLCCDAERGLLAAPLVAGSQGAPPDARAGLVGVVDTYTLQPLGAVLAHRTPVRAMRLNPSGQLLASASARGTVVRLWAVPSFAMLCSFRRGANECCIHGLGFSMDSLHLMAAAANGTVHIFRSPKEALDCITPLERRRPQASGQRDLEEDEDLSDWNIVDCDRSRLRERGLQGHVHKVKSLLTQLWQPCRDYLDGPSAIAWVHQGREESNLAPGSPRSPSLGPLLPLPPAMMEIFTPAFLACLPSHGEGRLVVASRGRGMLSSFDWSKGEGLLASRQALAADAVKEVGRMEMQTPPMRPMSAPLVVESRAASKETQASKDEAAKGETLEELPASMWQDEGPVEMELVVEDFRKESREALEGVTGPVEAEEASEAYEEDFDSERSEEDSDEEGQEAEDDKKEEAEEEVEEAQTPESKEDAEAEAEPEVQEEAEEEAEAVVEAAEDAEEEAQEDAEEDAEEAEEEEAEEESPECSSEDKELSEAPVGAGGEAATSRRERRALRREEQRAKALLPPFQESEDEGGRRKKKKGRRRSGEENEKVEEKGKKSQSRAMEEPKKEAKAAESEGFVKAVKKGRRGKHSKRDASDDEAPPDEEKAEGRRRARR